MTDKNDNDKLTLVIESAQSGVAAVPARLKIGFNHSRMNNRAACLLVPGILESRMSQETASVLGNSYRIYSLKPLRPYLPLMLSV